MVVPATVGSAAGTTRRAGMARGDGLVSRFKPSADDFELTFDPVEAPVASSRILVMSACMRLSSSGLMRDFNLPDRRFFLLDVVQQFDAFVADEAVPGRGYQAFDFALSLATAGAVDRLSAFTLPPPRPGTPQLLLCGRQTGFRRPRSASVPNLRQPSCGAKAATMR